MSLLTQLNTDLKEALKANDDMRKTTLRAVLAGTKQALLDKRQTLAKKLSPTGDFTPEQMAQLDALTLEDADVLSVLHKEAKLRQEASLEAQKAARPDLQAAAETELRVIESYLPKQLGRAEIVELAKAAIAEAGVTDLKQLGAVMKILTPRTKGQADGKLVNEVVRELLSH